MAYSLDDYRPLLAALEASESNFRGLEPAKKHKAVAYVTQFEAAILSFNLNMMEREAAKKSVENAEDRMRIEEKAISYLRRSLSERDLKRMYTLVPGLTLAHVDMLRELECFRLAGFYEDALAAEAQLRRPPRKSAGLKPFENEPG